MSVDNFDSFSILGYIDIVKLYVRYKFIERI